MWSQYDENLNKNHFFEDIQQNHSDIIKKACEENWIICVPRSGVFESNVSIEIILDHILIHGIEEQYCTLSKKPIVIKNRNIYTDANYQENGVEILFEETFYINKTSKYTVWCIDQPLFVKFKYCDSHISRNLEDIGDCVDFLWAESLGHSLLNDIKLAADKFIHQHEELGLESLQTVKEYVGELYSQCLQLGLKREILKEKSLNSKTFLDSFKLSVETYMQHCLGRHLVFAINTFQYQSDAFLNKVIRNSTDLELDDLGISHHYLDTITIAKRELGKINNYNTILDKITCVQRTFNIIYKNSEDKKLPINSDIILELLVYLLLKLKINNWMSNITFMKEFRLSLIVNSDQSSYFITNLEAAVEFIKSNKFLDIKYCKSKNNPSHDKLKPILDRISSGEIKSDVDIPLSSRNQSESNLCHPLCSCEKCEETDEEQYDVPSIIFNIEDENVLISAAKLGYCDIIEYFLKYKHYNVDAKDCFNKTILHYAAAKGYQDILLLSIIYNANVNATDDDKNTPLHLACLHGHEHCVKALIYSTPSVELNIGNTLGETPLHLATKWGFLDIIKVLLENGASLLVENNQKQTAVSLAPNQYVLNLFQHFGSQHSKKFHKEIKINDLPLKQENSHNFRHCKEHGVRPKNIDQYKKIDLLLKAIENNDFPLACFHLGFITNSSNNSEKDACHPLCRCDKCSSDQDFEFIAEHNNHNSYSINMCNVNGYTPLHIAAKYGRTDILRLLLDSGALPNVKTYKTLHTPLHLACMNQRIQTVRELLKCGNCKIDETDSEGNTPLFYAVSSNNLKMVEVLVDSGADCTKKNYADKSPLQESKDKMYCRVYRALKNNSINALARNKLDYKATENDLFWELFQ